MVLQGAGGASPLPASISSSSSSLSPLAPPFTVVPQPPSRRFAPNSTHPPSPARQYLSPSAASDWSSPGPAPVSAHQLPPIPPDTSSSHLCNYSPPVRGVHARDPFDHMGAGQYPATAVGPWSGMLDGQEPTRADVSSSWMEPSLDYKVSPLQQGGAADGLVSYQNASGDWHGKDVNSFTRIVNFGPEWLHDRLATTVDESTVTKFDLSEASVLVQSPSPKGMPYSHLHLPFSVMESKSKVNSNSYDAYKAYPAKECSTAAQINTQPSRRNDLPMDYSIPKNVYSVVQHVIPYKINDDCDDHIPSNQLEDNANKYFEAKEGYDERSGKGDGKEYSHMPIPLVSVKPGASSGTQGSNEISKVAESGLRLKRLNLPSAFTSENCPFKSNDSAESSLQPLDQLSLAVDSPCWKGAKDSVQYIHGFAEIVNHHPAVLEVKGCDDLDQDQGHLTFDGYSETLPSEEVRSLISSKKKKSTISNVTEPFYRTLPDIQLKFDEAHKAVKDCLKAGNGQVLQCYGVNKEQNEVRKEHNVDSNNSEKKKLNEEGHAVFADQLTIDDGVANLAKELKPSLQDISSDVNSYGKPLPRDNCMQLLVKTMHTLSEMLLSSYNGGMDQLKECDYELLHSAIHNMEVFTVRDKKAIQSQETGLVIDGIANHTVNQITHEVKRKIQLTGSSTNNNVIGGSAKSNSMAQFFESVLGKTLLEPEENPQALVYKNLWVEAEAALCSMKYELQLARMKVQMEDLKNQAKGRCPPVTSLSSLKSIEDLEEHHSPVKPIECLPNNFMPCLDDAGNDSNRQRLVCPTTNKIGEIDASVLARLRILKERVDKLGPANVKQQDLMGMMDDTRACGGAEGTVGILCSESKSSAESKHLPIKLDDLGFTDSNQQSNSSNIARDKDMPKLTRIKLGSQNCDKVFASNISVYSESREFLGSNSKGLAVKPCAQTMQEKSSLAGGHSSPTCDWEHVLKEDVI